MDEEICGYKIPKGAYIACLISAVHESEWDNPREWKPERFLPGGEYESFEDSIRPHKVRLKALHHRHEASFRLFGNQSLDRLHKICKFETDLADIKASDELMTE